ncbi:NLI interacting factor-like phosphatase-domain-containing protein [Xylaria bambusicola]|uniref:NLI interacting factor-like phosphatase-domain-containing protein n=1 Tax=Xylaria bambusicola TaxID=326684 RepID=UPI002008C797|nr:NLI interacting factor-like phosphatase-domain-containing protein [Xylaria bambusicola]KAI0514576.1 NLI interacting factor-like phosphatase-domain-containing protein [Xylaria bambusicola]
MNSLNIISARVSPTSSPAPSRTNSLSHIGLAVAPSSEGVVSSDDTEARDKDVTVDDPLDEHASEKDARNAFSEGANETSPLLEKRDMREKEVGARAWYHYPARIASGFIDSIRWVLSTIAAPGVYLIACLYDANGNFAPLHQLRNLFGSYGGNVRKLAADYQEDVVRNEKATALQPGGQSARSRRGLGASRRTASSGSSSSGISSESESDVSSRAEGNRLHTRSKSLQPTEEIAPSRRSIRIKLHNDDAIRHRKHRKAQSTNTTNPPQGGSATEELSAHLKSPTSPQGALTKYPKTPAPPRPLIPRRQPSYVPFEPQDSKQLKTLILDLDETLIHSMSKGGRMGSGHMVEVRLNTAYTGSSGQQMLGPQHPILYYVHKRPYCDEFLRKVCKWFNLVVFTASVQEYADPVIDWLESERKFFSGRYYRQHCTFRHGAFIKDLSSIEPDLSKVMILDNSPLSYMFHQDNAIPIQGWISDPTDNDLLHLVPFLEGLQYVSDVRALLALRGDLPPVKPSAIALGTVFNHGVELAVLTPLFGQTYQRAKVANTKEEFLRSREATGAAVAWGTSLVGSALQAYGVGALINATGTLSYKGAAYLGSLIFLATSAPTFLNQLFTEKRAVDSVAVSALAKVVETLGLSVFLTWWGTRTNPFD